MLILLGLNHRNAPLELRERLAFPEQEIGGALTRLLADETIEEGLILSTCNRVEVLAKAKQPDVGASSVREFLARERSIGREELNGCLYHYAGRDAVRHLFHVACGLDSMILGEPQILGQVKQAYAAARGAKTSGPILDHLMQKCFAVAKKVRTQTGISRHPLSIAYAAVELARQIFGDLEGRSVLVVGAGKMAGLTARHLASSGIAKILVASRSYSNAVVFTERYGGEPVPWDDIPAELGRVDVVVCGTAAPGIVIERTQVRRAMRARRSRPLFIIDIAVPRDVDPAVNDVDNVYLYDIDDLHSVVDHSIEERRRAAAEARRMVESQLDAFERWLGHLRVTPTIVALRSSLLEIRDGEHDRFRAKLNSLSPSQQGAVEELTRAIVQKILHRPITQLKSYASKGDASDYVALYHSIFGITDEVDGTDAEGREGEPSDEEPS